MRPDGTQSLDGALHGANELEHSGVPRAMVRSQPLQTLPGGTAVELPRVVDCTGLYWPAGQRTSWASLRGGLTIRANETRAGKPRSGRHLPPPAREPDAPRRRGSLARARRTKRIIKRRGRNPKSHEIELLPPPPGSGSTRARACSL